MKLLVVTQDMNIGGIQKSLLNLLDRLSKERIEITLLLFNKEGDYLNCLPSNVIIRDCGWLISSISKGKDQLIRDKNFIKVLMKGLLLLIAKLIPTNSIYGAMFQLHKIRESFDVAIAYSQDNYSAVFSKGCVQMVGEHINSKKKIAFLHSDITIERADYDDMKNKYKLIDYIINVSSTGKANFDTIFPEFREKSVLVKNIFQVDEIRSMAEEANNGLYCKTKKNLITVSRLSYLKGTDRIKRIVLELDSRGINDYCWHIVGEGSNEYESSILNKWAAENGVAQQIFFYGNQINPYPYIKNADVFVFPTRTEAFPMVTIESLILGTPVIAAKYSSSSEQINSGENGLVVSNFDDKFHSELLRIIVDGFPDINFWRRNAQQYQYDNEKNYLRFLEILRS